MAMAHPEQEGHGMRDMLSPERTFDLSGTSNTEHLSI